MSPKFMSPLAQQILELVTRQRNVTFAELSGLDGFAGGNLELSIPGHSNIVLWTGLTMAAADALEELRVAKAIHPVPASFLCYLHDGKVLKLPLARTAGAKRGYKKPHWLPVVFNPGADPDAQAA